MIARCRRAIQLLALWTGGGHGEQRNVFALNLGKAATVSLGNLLAPNCDIVETIAVEIADGMQTAVAHVHRNGHVLFELHLVGLK